MAFLHWKRGDLTTYPEHAGCDDHFVSSLHEGLTNEGYYIQENGRVRLSAAMTDHDIDGFVEAIGGVVKSQVATGSLDRMHRSAAPRPIAWRRW